jgi:lactate 2-monooxygenase
MGVEQVVKHTLSDLEITMGLCGYKNLCDIQGGRDEVVSKVDL